MYEIAYAILVFLFVLFILKSFRKKRLEKENEINEKISFQNIYQQKWMFTHNEKDAFWKLKRIAERSGYLLFAKVRLFDLVEPIRGTKKYMTYLNKVKSKHVDFVFCNQKLVAKFIIELDDMSHDTAKRKERDTFVDATLKAAGYRVLHIRAVDEKEIENFMQNQ